MENISQFDNNMDDVLKIVNKHADDLKRKEEKKWQKEKEAKTQNRQDWNC